MTTEPARSAVDHAPGRAQRWPDADDDLRVWIEQTVEVLRSFEGVIGVYLHGSLATTGMYRPKSDVDVLVAVSSPLDDDARRRVGGALVELHDRRSLTGALELSVVTATTAADPPHPAPFEFHFGENWVGHYRAGGVGPTGIDPDLTAHFTVVRARGVALAGPAPAEVFRAVGRDAYLAAILDDLGWIVDGGIVESPYYGVLNLCRCAHELLDQPPLPPSKEESATWALANLPVDHRQVVAEALECYRAVAPTPPAQRRRHGHDWNEAALRSLASWARSIVGVGG